MSANEFTESPEVATKPVMVVKRIISTIGDLNAEGERFWPEKSKKVEEQMHDPSFNKAAMILLESDAKRLLPLAKQRTLEAALDEAERIRRVFLSEAGRKGGGTKKADTLTKFIERAVAKSPDLSERDLRVRLREASKSDSALLLDDKTILWDEDGEEHSVQVGKLKHRLSRAKARLKNNSSRKAD